MRAFLDYLCGMKPASDLTSDIDKVINYAKNNKVWEIEYMHIMGYLIDATEDAREEGFAEGREAGEAVFAELVKKLSESGRSDDIIKAAADKEYRKQLYQEFGVTADSASAGK